MACFSLMVYIIYIINYTIIESITFLPCEILMSTVHEATYQQCIISHISLDEVEAHPRQNFWPALGRLFAYGI